MRQACPRRSAQHAMSSQGHGDSDHCDVQREGSEGPACGARVSRGRGGRRRRVRTGVVLGVGLAANVRRLRVRRVRCLVAIASGCAWGSDWSATDRCLGDWRTGARSFFGKLALAAFCATAVVANVVHHHSPLPVVR
eukprot:3544167-Pleurochrysis_carterae.AAC.1